MRRREACPTRTREESRPERFMGDRRSFGHVGKSGLLKVASLGVSLGILPKRAKSRAGLSIDPQHWPSRLELPLGQALAAPGQEDGNGIGRADDAFAQLEEALD